MDYYDAELYHYGIKGMKWGVRRYRNKDGSLTPRAKKKIADAERYLGRKLETSDGFSEDGSDITRKGLKNVKQWDEQEKRYKSIKKKDDPVYDYVRGFDLRYGNALSVKDVNRIIKKMEKNPSLNVMSELEKTHRAKAGRKAVSRVLAAYGTTAVAVAVTSAAAQRSR